MIIELYKTSENKHNINYLDVLKSTLPDDEITFLFICWYSGIFNNDNSLFHEVIEENKELSKEVIDNYLKIT